MHTICYISTYVKIVNDPCPTPKSGQGVTTKDNIQLTGYYYESVAQTLHWSGYEEPPIGISKSKTWKRHTDFLNFIVVACVAEDSLVIFRKNQKWEP